MLHRALLVLLALAALVPVSAPAWGQDGWGHARVVKTIRWVEEWDPASQSWVRVDEEPSQVPHTPAPPTRFIAALPVRAHDPGIARYGPFRVLDASRAALVASTDAHSPQAFAAMLAAHPALRTIEFVDAPGTSNDVANLALGRAIRAAGLATHVPAGGSARSGAVELFLASTARTIAPGALFAVHSWRDERGREPDDFAPDSPENRLYLDYYGEMGMSEAEARAFYAMTNSVPHQSALWLAGEEMARWIAPPRLPEPAITFAFGGQTEGGEQGNEALCRFAEPRLAYADVMGPALALLDSSAAFP